MIGFLIVFLLVGMVEGLVVFWHRKIVEDTRISTLADSDYAVPRKAALFALGQPFAALVVALVVSLFQLSAWAFILIFLIYFVARIGLALQDWENAKASMALRLVDVFERDEVADSRFAFYFSAGYIPEPFHVTMWLESLVSLDVPFVILAQDRKHFKKIPVSPKYSVICVQGIAKKHVVLPPSMGTVFYANNGMANFEFMRHHSDRTHVQLLHGDSDKPPSFNPASKAYDYLFVAGEMAIDRYKLNNVRIPADRFRVVGRPQVGFQDKTKADEVVVVYMPTWSGFEETTYSSFRQSLSILEGVLATSRVTEVIFKPHPLSHNAPEWNAIRSGFERLAGQSGVEIRWAKADESPFDLYAKANVLISDISSTIIDYLYAGKPYLVTNPQNFDETGLRRYPSASGGYLIDQDAGNVRELLELALGDDPIAEKREQVRKHAFGDLGRPPGVAFQEACWELIGRPEEKS